MKPPFGLEHHIGGNGQDERRDAKFAEVLDS
jgi:hypothetical protein